MEKIRQDKILNVPNALTMLRFALMPFFVWQFFSGHMAAAFFIYVAVQREALHRGGFHPFDRGNLQLD